LSNEITSFESKIVTPERELNEINEKIKGKKEDDIDKAVKDNKEKLEKEIEEINGERKNLLATFGKENELLRQVCDLALLSNGMLKGEDLNRFVKRSLSLIS
jgi:molecular chaperone HtpG